MLTLTHTDYPNPCGGVAFYFNGVLGEVLTAENIAYPDGSHPIPESRLKCGNCGNVIAVSSVTWQTAAPNFTA